MRGKKVLVADDAPNIVRSIKLVLEEEGYQVLTAADGMETLRLARDEPIDLIILDVRMPKISGQEVYRRLKEDKKIGELPVIILSAFGQEIPQTEGWELHGVDYITKPFSPYAIVERVNKILGN